MFRFTDKSPITFQDPLPDSVDVVVIGGGIIGISTAWYLRKLGVSVFVCEKGRIAGEQSSRNWGWIRVTLRDPAEVPVAIDSSRYWEEISQEVEEDIGFSREGLLILAESSEEMAAFEDWRNLAKAHQHNTLLFSKNEIHDHVIGANGDWIGGVLTKGDARAEPFKAAPAMARALQKMGGAIRENCAVRFVEKKAGRVSAVITEHGAIDCNAIVCAAGSWSSMFLSNLGVSLPQLAVRGTVARTAEAPSVFEGNAGFKDIYVRKRQDGGYTVAAPFFEHFIGADSFRFLPPFSKTAASATNIGLRINRDPTQQKFPARKWAPDEISPFELHRVLDPVPSQARLKQIRQNLDKRLPALKNTPIVESWAGMIDATPDVVPVMDQVTAINGLFLATGFSGHGFGIGPAAGKIMADLVVGNKPPYDLSRFRFSRFSDGSKLTPGPAI